MSIIAILLMVIIALFIFVSPIALLVLIIKKAFKKNKPVNTSNVQINTRNEDMKDLIQEIQALKVDLQALKDNTSNESLDCNNCRHKINLERILKDSKYK